MASEADEGPADGRRHGQKDKEVQCGKQELSHDFIPGHYGEGSRCGRENHAEHIS